MFDVRWVFGVVGLAICAGCSSGEVEVQDFDDQVLEIPSNYDEQPELATSGKQIVYVNFDGVTIRDCDNYCSDARSDRSWAIGAHFGGSSNTFARYAGSSSQRDSIMSDLRAGGDRIGGPPPFAKEDRSRFLSALDNALQALIRRSP